MTDRKIKFAVIGCGHIGKRHAEMILRNADAELSAIVDILPENELGIDDYNTAFYNSIEECITAIPSIDVVCICTPNGYHAEHAGKCLEAGKHIVVEKPLAISLEDAKSIYLKASQMGKHLFPVMQNRYSPPSVWLKELMDSGRLGNIYMVQISCYWNRDDRYYKEGSWHGTKSLDGGTLFTQFSHFIDIMYWLFGDIKNIHSRLNVFNHHELTEFEDSGFVSFDFVNGGMGCFNFSTSVWNKNLESSITIIAENGSVRVGGQYMDKVEYCHVKDYEMPELKATNPGNDYGAYKGSAMNHNFLIDNVIDILKGRGGVTALPEDGVKVVEMIDRIYNSDNALNQKSAQSIKVSSI